MRIVITKNGKIIIREINPDIKFKNLLQSHNQLGSRRFGNQSKLSHSRNNSFGNTSNNLSIHSKNKNIDDVLFSVQSQNKNTKSSSQCKILNIDPNKHLMLPQSIVERYFDDQSSLETEDKNLLPDVFVSINKSIEKDANTKGFNYVYNNISSLQSMHEKEIEDNFSRKKIFRR